MTTVASKNSHRFRLPNHTWVPIGCQNFAEEIRVEDGWRLVRKIKFMPTSDDAKRNLQRPPETKAFTGKLKFSRIELDSIKLTKIMGHLAEIVERGLAEKQEAKKPITKVSRLLRAKAGATEREIRDAAWLLHYLVNFGCSRLMEIVKNDPEVLKPIARMKPSWPLMMALHPGHSVHHKKLLKSLCLGDAYEFDTDEISRDNTHRTAIEKGTREIAESLFYFLKVEWNHFDQKLDGKPVAAFTEASSSLWWDVAKLRFLQSYPDPLLVPELARILTAPSRKLPAHKKSFILRKIKEAFLGLAKRP
jgi:hypothetical protein